MTQLILSLDNLTFKQALNYAHRAQGRVWGFKVNDLLLRQGAEVAIRYLTGFGHVMTDPKLYDIPNTMSNSIRTLRGAGASIITVHCSSGYVPQEDEREHLAGITCLTSMDDTTCERVYGKLRYQVVNQMMQSCDYAHVVCGVGDLPMIPTRLKSICPGIRPSWYGKQDDQVHRATPAEAREAGADYIVVGRPVIQADDFDVALDRVLEELG